MKGEDFAKFEKTVYEIFDLIFKPYDLSISWLEKNGYVSKQ